MITYDRLGGRTVELFIPFEIEGGRKVEAISFQPVRFDDTLSFREGKYKTILSLMAKMSGLDEMTLREVRYPDIERVMAVFLDMLPPEIKDVMNVSQPYQSPPEEEEVNPVPSPDSHQMTNGHDKAAPLPPTEPDYIPSPPPDGDPTGLGVDLDGTAG